MRHTILFYKLIEFIRQCSDTFGSLARPLIGGIEKQLHCQRFRTAANELQYGLIQSRDGNLRELGRFIKT